jgi:hypothetical protein
MNSRERILAAVRREEVDYVPCFGSFNPLTPAQLMGRTWNFPWSPEASEEERLAYQVRQLSLDEVVDVGVNLCRPAPGVASRAWLEGDVLHKVYTTPAGDLHASIRYNILWPWGRDIPFYDDFNIGHFVKPWIENESDLECFRQVRRLSDTRDVLEEERAILVSRRKLADRFSLAMTSHVGMGLTGAMQLFGASPLCMMTIENPGLVDAYLEHEHQINLRTIEVLGDLGLDYIHRNGFYETADFYSPAMLERFIGRRLRREADAAHAAGMLAVYTVHTGVMPILDYLGSLTMDSFVGIDIAFKGVDLRKAKEKLLPTKSLWIGPSSTYHLWHGPEATRRAVRQVFDVIGKTGLILTQCVSSHSIMPWESTLAMIDEWRMLR